MSIKITYKPRKKENLSISELWEQEALRNFYS